MNGRFGGTLSWLGAAICVVALVGSSVKFDGLSGHGAYGGRLAELHRAAGSMESVDRQGLSEALDAGATMLERDAAGLVTTTAQAQRFARGVIGFGYTSFAVKKYPPVAAAIQTELEKAAGENDVRMTPELRARVVDALRESAAAVR